MGEINVKSFSTSAEWVILCTCISCEKDSLTRHYIPYWIPLACAGILEQYMGSRNRVGLGLSYRPARIHRLAESIPWNRFLGFLKNWKYRLVTEMDFLCLTYSYLLIILVGFVTFIWEVPVCRSRSWKLSTHKKTLWRGGLFPEQKTCDKKIYKWKIKYKGNVKLKKSTFLRSYSQAPSAGVMSLSKLHSVMPCRDIKYINFYFTSSFFYVYV